MCYSCGYRASSNAAKVTVENKYNTTEYIKFKCSVSKKNLSALFALIGFSNESPAAINGKVYSVNSIIFLTAKLIPITDSIFSGDIIFKITSSDKQIDFSQIFSLVEEEQ